MFGVKGISLLAPFISIYHIPIDYMHAILEGVVKAFLCCWINPKYAELRFYLGKVVNIINKFCLELNHHTSLGDPREKLEQLKPIGRHQSIKFGCCIIAFQFLPKFCLLTMFTTLLY